MIINTKKIREGIITIDKKPIKVGMLISDIEQILGEKIDVKFEGTHYTFAESLIEDGKTISLGAVFNNKIIKTLFIEISPFNDYDTASEHLNNWMNERNIISWVGSDEINSYFDIESGSLSHSISNIVDFTSSHYGIEIEITNEKAPNRDFSPIKENPKNTAYIQIDDVKYKIQRIPIKEVDSLHLHNCLGGGPIPLGGYNEKHSKDDRIECVYFNISKIENDIEKVLGVAEFTYMAIWDIYRDNELFIVLDNLTEEWGIIGFMIDKYGCGLTNNKGITPYILCFEGIHGTIPYNEELSELNNNKTYMQEFFKAVTKLTSKYVKIAEEYITLLSINNTKSNIFSYYKKINDIFINYQRSEKNATITNASGNASVNSLKYQINIPADWARQIGLTKNNKSVLMTFDGETISIKRKKNQKIKK